MTSEPLLLKKKLSGSGRFGKVAQNCMGGGGNHPLPPVAAPMKPMPCCFIGVCICKVYFFRRPKYGTVIDDVLCSLWFSTDTVRWVIQTPMKHVEIKASHYGPGLRRRFKVIHSFLGRFALEDGLVSGVTVNCLGRFILFQESLQVSRRQWRRQTIQSNGNKSKSRGGQSFISILALKKHAVHNAIASINNSLMQSKIILIGVTSSKLLFSEHLCSYFE